jgi:hypothetical protein
MFIFLQVGVKGESCFLKVPKIQMRKKILFKQKTGQ